MLERLDNRRRCVVRVMVEMLAPYKGRVYDPRCGSAGMFAQSEKFVEEHGGRIGDIAVYGQESNSTTRRLAMMNLAIRGIEGDLGLEHADTFRRHLHKDLKADYVRGQLGTQHFLDHAPSPFDKVLCPRASPLTKCCVPEPPLLLANIEFEAGNYGPARQHFERSIRITESNGDVAGRASMQSMLAQLEALEGRFDRAMELASQAVERLEQLGNSDAENAREVLRNIEQDAALAGASVYAVRLHKTFAAWQSLSAAERLTQLAALNGTADDSAEAVLSWLAHCATCWQQDDVAGSSAALAQAQTLAVSSKNAALVALVSGVVEQRDADRSGGSATGPEVAAALKLLQEDNVEAAQPVLENALAQARAAGDLVVVATCQFYLGHVALQLDHPAEAVTALHEALELATQVGETDLIKRVQQLLTIATREANGTAKP